jgi:DNA-binding response OmpR family regulator
MWRTGGASVVDVAVINTSEEIAQALEWALQDEGWTTARAFTLDFKAGRQDLAAFLRQHDPRAIVWDIAIPYEENWAFCQQAQQLPETQGLPFVLTATNQAALEGLVGPTNTLEIIGKPFDLQRMIDAVRRALG